MRTVLFGFLAAVLCLLSPANETLSAGQSQQAKPLSAADLAFRDALNTKESDARLAAFRKLISDFPDSDVVKYGAPHFNIFGLATGIVGKEAKEARAAAEAYIASMPADSRDRLAWGCALLAMSFARTECMWADAEHYARKALEYWDAGASSGPPRTAGQTLERALPLWFLGQALEAQHRDNEAERYLREAYEDRANEPAIVGQVMPLLLDIARRRGRDDDRVECLVALALHGRLAPALRTELEDSYRRTHNGSLDGLEAMLDSRYETEMPKAIPVEPFVRPEQPGARTVLAEMFTGASCSPCVGMDLALEAAMRRYQPRDLAVLVYHQHTPAPDPLVNTSAEVRAKLYGLGPVPYLFIDGVKQDDEGGGKASEAGAILRTRVQPAIERAMQSPAGARLTLDATRAGNVITARVALNGVSPNASALRLHVALAEDRVRYSGSNGIRFHPMVVRKMAGEGAGIVVPAAGRLKTQVIFDINAIEAELESYLDNFEKKRNDEQGPFAFDEKKCDLAAGKLIVVAFVQEEASHRVLQSSVAAAASPSAPAKR